jgi:hypothetical protein
VKDDTLGFLNASTMLRGDVKEVTGDEIRRRNGNRCLNTDWLHR